MKDTKRCAIWFAYVLLLWKACGERASNCKGSCFVKIGSLPVVAIGLEASPLADNATFDQPAHRIVLQESIDLVDDPGVRLARLEQQIADTLPRWSLRPVVKAIQAMRGVSFISAVTVAAETGDLRRFDKPRQLMSYLAWCPPNILPGRDATGRHNEGWQQECAAHADRGRLDLPIAGTDRARASGATC